MFKLLKKFFKYSFDKFKEDYRKNREKFNHFSSHQDKKSIISNDTGNNQSVDDIDSRQAIDAFENDNLDQYYNVDIDEEIYSALTKYIESTGGPDILAAHLEMSPASIKGWLSKKTTRITPRNWLKLSPILGIKREFVVAEKKDFGLSMAININDMIIPAPKESAPSKPQITNTVDVLSKNDIEYNQYITDHPEIIFVGNNGQYYKFKYETPIIVSIERPSVDEIRKLLVHKLEQTEFYDCYITGFCFLRKAERTFKVDQGDGDIVRYEGQEYTGREFYFHLKDQLFSSRTHAANYTDRIPITESIIAELNKYIGKHSLKQLSGELGIASSTIRNWINGNTTGINNTSWQKLNQLLGSNIKEAAEAQDIKAAHQEEKPQFKEFYNLLNKTYEPYDAAALLNNRNLIYEKAVQELQGISFAISYDNELSDSEIEVLAKWLEKNIHFKDKWPILDVYGFVMKAIETRKIDTEWKREVLEFLKSISACQDVTGLDFDSTDDLDFNGKNVVITGTFENGMSRESVEDSVMKLGGYFNSHGNIGPQIEILVVGEKGSKAWRFGGYGRKIEVALEMRKNTGCPLIIKESDFLQYIEKQKRN